MSFFSFRRSVRYVAPGRAARSKRSRPQVEALEDRTLPSAATFVNALYADGLLRSATSSEVQSGVAQLNAGVSRVQLAVNLLTTSEYAADLITTDFQNILGRAPDPGALAAWTPFVTAKGDPYFLEAAILGSPEFYQRAGGTTQAWLNGLYQVALNRNADSGGLAAWTGALQAGLSRLTVVEGILYSSEGLRDIVTQDYREMLSRTPDTGGLTAWMSVLQSGVNNTQVAAYFFGSNEFYQDVSQPTVTFPGVPTTPPSNSWPTVPSAPPSAWTPGFVPPPPPGIPKPGSGTVTITGISPDTGVSSTDGITDSANLSAVGKGPANTAFTSYVDGVKDVSGTTDKNGAFSIPLSHALAQGSHILSTQAGPQAGAGSGTSAFKIYVDLTAPSATLTAPDFTETTTPTVSVTASDNYTLASTFYVDVDLNNDGNFSDPGEAGYAKGTIQSGQSQLTLRTLPEGTYQLQARIYDVAGNETDSSATMQIDPNAGVLGSQSLKDLYYYSQGTPAATAKMLVPKANFDPNIFMYDSQGRVLVHVRSTLTKYMGALRSELVQNLGMTVLQQYPTQNMLIGYLPINQVMNLPNQAHFSAATPVLKPHKNTGSVNTEGDKVIQADTFRANTGFDGSGQTVGVLSDSVNEFQGGLADSVKTGDLPPNVNVLEDETDGKGTDEGRAMLEIVHDIAPGASLAFHSGVNSEQDFAQGISDLQNLAGATVVADDIGWADEPMFNDGIIAQAATAVHDNGGFYASAAGNQANQGWTAPWNPVAATVGNVTGTFESFGSGVIQHFQLAANGTIVLSFEWDAAFLEGGSPLPNFQVPNDMAVYVTDATGKTILATFDDNNKNTDMAFEFVAFTNSTAGTYGLAFQLHNADTDPNPTTLRWVNFGGDDPMADGEGAATSFGHPVAPGAVAVGAVPWFSPDTPEPFTSQGGPVQINFDSDGNRIPPEIRTLLPEVAAPDGVSTSFFGDPFGNQKHAFFGTSAATPHVAGAAALLFQQASQATTDDVLLHLETTAIDVPAPGFDNLTGFGRIIVTPITFVSNPSGDRFELNDTSDTASQMGVLGVGLTKIEGLSILNHLDGLRDYDWYRWTAGITGTMTAQVMVGRSSIRLELHVFTVDTSNTLIELGSSTVPTKGFLSVSVPFTAGEPVLVEVKGLETSIGVWGQGPYTLEMNLD